MHKYYILANLTLFLFGNCFTLHGQDETYSQVKVYIENETDIQRLYELGLDIDHFSSGKDNSISFFIRQHEIEILDNSALNFDITIADFQAFYDKRAKEDQGLIRLAERQQRTANNFGYGSMGGFYTLAEIESKLDQMYTLFPNLITEKFSIGTSFEGRSIWAAKISDNPDIDENEAVAYYDALHHAREPLSMAVTINYMFWLLENYNTDPLVKHIIDHRELYFVPCVNPDGYEYNRQINPNGGGLWRKNRRDNGSCDGVDLNRNYSFAYGFNSSCSSTNPCSNTYRGTNPFSEPESSSVSSFISSINPTVAFSIHSTAGNYLMPYGYNTSPPDYNIYSEWASDFLSENDYPYGVTYEMLGYTSCGTTRDYLHSEGIYGWTPEIDGSGFWPLQSEIFALVDENIYPLFYQAWIAGGYTDIQSHTISGNAIAGETFQVIIEVKNKGVGSTSSNVTVNIESTDSDISISGNGNLGSVASRTRQSSSPFNILVDANFTGQEVELILIVSEDGIETDREMISVSVGSPNTLFSDNAESGNGNWTATGNGKSWGINNDDSYSGNSSFGDSDDGNSQNNTTNYFTQNGSINLFGTTKPILEFMSKWSLESGDYVRLQISQNGGNNWTTLKQFEANESWHQEIIDLNNYIGSNVSLRFFMDTDGSIPADGFYFDDLSIVDYLPCAISQSCDDNDSCTTGESYDSDCNCVGGVFQDSDNDGVCDADDICPNFDDNLIGTICNDNDICTVGETYDSNCNCTGGIYLDSDNDGLCDGEDPCPDFNNKLINSPCNDLDVCTLGETYDFNCDCTGGIFQDSDNDGVCDAEDLCPNFDNNLINMPCDDLDACTIGETYDANCNCTGGVFQDSDNDGFCDAVDQCPNFDDNLIGKDCDDNNDCTIGETYDSNCNCSGGVLDDPDMDGICESDPCPNLNNNLIGMPCNDGDVCTIDDVFTWSCKCIGDYIDSDNDGICDANEINCANISYDDFELVQGIWNSGGIDAARVLSTFSPSGNYSMRIRDNSFDLSSIYTNILDLSAIDTLHIYFLFQGIGMEENEDFFLEISNDGGLNYILIEEWNSGVEFINDVIYNESVSVTSPYLNNQTVLRFRCDGTINSDEVFIDNINLEYCEYECEDIFSLIDNSIINQSQFVNNTIESNGIIYSNSDIEYSAGEYIVLNPGFEIEISAQFHAYIEACQ